MSDTTLLPEGVEKGEGASELWQIAGLPDWLEAVSRPEIVSAALARHVAETRSPSGITGIQ